ncbi:MAG: SMC-Scp complex subunit ScpB, partial [Anaerolineales bacterium]|nr:SMC-Scp complex subunit ScpB [Anaerolineales bacterium]
MSESNLTSPATELSLVAQLEALLFVAPGATAQGALATALGVTPRQVENALQELDESYQQRGLRLQRNGGRVQLTSAPEAAGLIEHFLGLEATSSLSRAALEALAIIAYQQPVT